MTIGISGRRAMVAASWAFVASAAQAADASVTIDNFAFTPNKLTGDVGSRIVFTNHDDIPHTVTSAATPALFKSAPLDSDESFAFTFGRSGTYAYFCSLHPYMQGTIVVR